MTQDASETQADSRTEHLAWCKQRALEYVDRGDLADALASMASDVRKHPGTDTPATTMLLALEGTRCVMNADAAGMRRFIEGFN
jgi:hypothetical protein